MQTTDVLSKLDTVSILALCGMLVGVIAILGGITIAITKVVSDHFRKSQINEMEATLKMEMIQRGMSALDIKQVLEVKMSSNRSRSLGDKLGCLPQVSEQHGCKPEAQRT